MYDIIIVGGGISGLYTAYNLYKINKNFKICLVEASNRIGGRLQSIEVDNIILDTGAARFNNTHILLNNLIKELKLDKYIKSISSDILFKNIQFNNNIDDDDDDMNINLKMMKEYKIIDDFIKDINNKIKNKKINKIDLKNTTLLNYSITNFKHYPKLSSYLTTLYPYYSELAILNAQEALKLFTNEFNKKTQYYILTCGLEQIAKKLIKILKKNKNFKLIKNTSVNNITYYINKLSNKNIPNNIIYKLITNNDKLNSLEASYIILAIPKPSLLQIPFLSKIKSILNQISIQPLYRIFAKYPRQKLNDLTYNTAYNTPYNTTNLQMQNNISERRVWFDGMPKISTDLDIKYIIPINYDKGIIMISYTDGKFAENMLKLGLQEEKIKNNLKQLFPLLNIPEPIWIKHYYWKNGAGYWKQKYEFSMKHIKPFEKQNIYICGENYSDRQAWVEGALRSTQCAIKLFKKQYIKKYKTNKIKNTNNLKIDDTSLKIKKSIKYYISRMNLNKKTHTLKKLIHNGGSNKYTKKKDKKKDNDKQFNIDEVKKHNNRNDAWIVINKKVYNITTWIDKHPGGDIILSGIGKDATKQFNSIFHSENAKKILATYFIGNLMEI